MSLRTAEDDEQVAERSEDWEHREQKHEVVEAASRGLSGTVPRCTPVDGGCRKRTVSDPVDCLDSRDGNRGLIRGPGRQDVEVLLSAVLGDEREHCFGAVGRR